MARARHETYGRGPEVVGPPRTTWATGWNVLLGIWLIISPWVLGYGALGAAVWDAVVVGAAIFIIAAIRLGWARQARPLSWLNVLLGLWLIISPWVVNVARNRPAPYWNDVIVGIVVAVLAWIAASTPAGRGEARV